MINAGKKTNAVSNKVVSQTGTGGKSGTQRTATGSSSRPGMKAKYPIESSNPGQSQMIRPKNTIGGTGFKG